jgi:hydrogenase maturation protease
MPKTLILGVGNLLLSDDGVGIRVIQKLETLPGLPEDVQLLDGGTCGLDLLQYLEGVENLVVVDAADFGELPGSIHRIEGDAVPAYLEQKISPHEISLPELLFSARLIGIYPQRVIILGIQPESLAVGMDLTPAVDARVDQLAALALAEARPELLIPIR